MKKCIEDLKTEYIKKLSLRSTTGSIEALAVEVDEREYMLQELAQIIRKNPGLVVINMGAFPQAIPAALKAIQSSGMNLNPQQDGTTLYVPVPKVTKEHRENLAKGAKTMFVHCKDHIRDIQNQCIKKLKKRPGLGEDLMHSVQDQISSLADQHITEAENIMSHKQAELLGQA